MPAIPIIGAAAAVVGAGVSIWSAVNNYNQGEQQASFNADQLEIAQGQINIAKENSEISRQNIELQTKNSHLNAINQIRGIQKEVTDLKAAQIQGTIDIRDAESQVESYDKWLENYSGQYTQEVASRQAQTDQFKAAGKEVYENFLNTIGYNDAVAGATGRVGANTSQAKMAGMLDRHLVDYVGEDRTLDANGGLYGSQMTAANLEMEQLKTDLEFQRQEMTANRENVLATIGDYQQAQVLREENIKESEEAKGEIEDFIENNFGTPEEDPADLLKSGNLFGGAGPTIARPVNPWVYAGRKTPL
jgi:hypothetical protein